MLPFYGYATNCSSTNLRFHRVGSYIASCFPSYCMNSISLRKQGVRSWAPAAHDEFCDETLYMLVAIRCPNVQPSPATVRFTKPVHSRKRCATCVVALVDPPFRTSASGRPEHCLWNLMLIFFEGSPTVRQCQEIIQSYEKRVGSPSCIRYILLSRDYGTLP